MKSDKILDSVNFDVKSNEHLGVQESNSIDVKLEWDTPSISVIKIQKLTAGFLPGFKEWPLPGMAAGS